MIKSRITYIKKGDRTSNKPAQNINTVHKEPANHNHPVTTGLSGLSLAQGQTMTLASDLYNQETRPLTFSPPGSFLHNVHKNVYSNATPCKQSTSQPCVITLCLI